MLQEAYNDLDVVKMNYINLRSLILSYNKYDLQNSDQASMNVFCRLSTIDMKLFKLKLDRWEWVG